MEYKCERCTNQGEITERNFNEPQDTTCGKAGNTYFNSIKHVLLGGCNILRSMLDL